MEAVCAGKTVGRQGGGNAEAVAGVDPARDVWVRAEAGEAASLCGRAPVLSQSAGSELRSSAGRAGRRAAEGAAAPSPRRLHRAEVSRPADHDGILRYIVSRKVSETDLMTCSPPGGRARADGRPHYGCRLSENFHCCDSAGPHTSTLRPPVLAARLSRHRLLPTCRSLELPSICSHFCKRQEDTFQHGCRQGRARGSALRVCRLRSGQGL